jgi:hypothetical protein
VVEPLVGPSNLKILVKQRAYNIFMAMFPKSSEDGSRDIAWDTFALVMGEVGFSARNAGGLLRPSRT